MSEKYCQSCAMPLTPEFYGTGKDGSPCDVYCSYCFQNGSFTQEMTMDEMIEHNLLYLDEWNKDAGMDLTAEEAREQLRAVFPKLKRWQ